MVGVTPPPTYVFRLPATTPTAAKVVLGAIDAVLDEQKTSHSPTAYFGALMSTLEQQQQQQQSGQFDPNVEGVVYLLSLLLQSSSVPTAVLVRKHAQVASVLLGVLQQCPEATAACKRLLVCLSALPAATGSKEATRVLQAMLVFSADPRPKLRRIAQQGAVRLLQASVSESGCVNDQIALVVLQSCERELKQHRQEHQHHHQQQQKDGDAAELSVLHLCALLRQIVPLMPLKASAELLQHLFGQLVHRASRMLLLHTMLCVRALFDVPNRTPDHHELEHDFVLRLLDAVDGLRPNFEDEVTAPSYIHAMSAGVQRLHRCDRSAAIARLAPFFALLPDALLSSKPKVVAAASQAMQHLLGACIDGAALLHAAAGSPLQSIGATVSSLLSFRYKAVWKSALAVVAAVFAACQRGSTPPVVIQPLLTALADIVDAADDVVCGSDRTAARSAIGVALDTLGADVVLDALPLLLPLSQTTTTTTDGLEGARVWLLRLVREHGVGSPLAVFTRRLLPAAQSLASTAVSCRAAKRPVEARALHAIVTQLWETLPTLARSPPDAVTEVPLLAPALADAVNLTDDAGEDDEVASAALRGIAVLCQSSGVELGAQCRLLLPPLFARVVGCADERRQPLLDVIAALAEIAPDALLNRLFKSVLKNLLASESETSANAMMDLATALAARLDEPNRWFLHRAAAPRLQSDVAQSQKKAYRALTTLMRVGHGRGHGRAHVDAVLRLLQEALPKLSASSRRLRLGALAAFCGAFLESGERRREVVPLLLAEVILGVKEQSVRCREAAYAALRALKAQFALHNESEEFVLMVLGGLAGTQHMKSASVLALSAVLYEERRNLSAECVSGVLETVLLLLLHDKSREVVKAVLGFVKVAVSVLQTPQLQPHLGAVVGGLMRWCDDSKNRFRQKTRVILERLLRRFDDDDVRAFVTDKHMPLLDAIVKEQKRKGRKHRVKDDVEPGAFEPSQYENLLFGDEDDDDDDDVKSKKDDRATMTTTKKSVRVMEREGQPLDLLDARETTHALLSAPKTKKRRRHDDDDDDAKFAEDKLGKLVICDEDEDEDKDDDDDDDDDDDGENAPMSSVKNSSAAKASKKKENIDRALNGRKYKAKRAGGDVRVSGDKHQPFAYIGLNPKALSQRHKRSTKGTFEGLVAAAKRGSNKGAKQQQQNASKRARHARRR